VLHHPEYRERYAGNLKRELPRIPLVGLTPQPPSPAPDPTSQPLGKGEPGAAGASAGAAVGSAHADPPFPGGMAVGLEAREGGQGVRFFRALADAGAALADLHLHYEQLPPYELQFLQNHDVPVNWRVTKMRLTPDKDAVIVNDFLTLAGIPPEVSEYRLGNRSALEWVIDQYQVRTDKRSGITSDPNHPEDPEYIVRLAGQVVRVSLETVRIVRGLPGLG